MGHPVSDRAARARAGAGVKAGKAKMSSVAGKKADSNSRLNDGRGRKAMAATFEGQTN